MLAVFDTNVLVSGLRSARGASNAVLQRVALGLCQAAISTALLLEYEDVLNRPRLLPSYSSRTIAMFLDSFCSVASESFTFVGVPSYRTQVMI
jgi:predicted nucleic acid-binding protein